MTKPSRLIAKGKRVLADYHKHFGETPRDLLLVLGWYVDNQDDDGRVGNLVKDDEAEIAILEMKYEQLQGLYRHLSEAVEGRLSIGDAEFKFAASALEALAIIDLLSDQIRALKKELGTMREAS